MFKRFFYTRLLMVNTCDTIASIWRNRCSHQIQMMGKNVNQKAVCLKHQKKAIKYADKAERWLNRGTKIIDQMKEES